MAESAAKRRRSGEAAPPLRPVAAPDGKRGGVVASLGATSEIVRAEAGEEAAARLRIRHPTY